MRHRSGPRETHPTNLCKTDQSTVVSFLAHLLQRVAKADKKRNRRSEIRSHQEKKNPSLSEFRFLYFVFRILWRGRIGGIRGQADEEAVVIDIADPLFVEVLTAMGVTCHPLEPGGDFNLLFDPQPEGVDVGSR